MCYLWEPASCSKMTGTVRFYVIYILHELSNHGDIEINSAINSFLTERTYKIKGKKTYANNIAPEKTLYKNAILHCVPS